MAPSISLVIDPSTGLVTYLGNPFAWTFFWGKHVKLSKPVKRGGMQIPYPFSFGTAQFAANDWLLWEADAQNNPVPGSFIAMSNADVQLNYVEGPGPTYSSILVDSLGNVLYQVP